MELLEAKAREFAPEEVSEMIWMSDKSTNCQLCDGKLGKVFYDARLPRSGQWGVMCHSCFTEQGCSLGLGRGQKYDSVTLEKLEG